MSHSISTLLIRNLDGVFGENDPARQRATIEEIFHEDAIFHDPHNGAYRGRDEIDRVAGAIRATHPRRARARCFFTRTLDRHRWRAKKLLRRRCATNG